MAERSDITPDVVRELLRYEPETGCLFWLSRPREMFPDFTSYRAWNARYAGKEAFASKHCNNYRVGSIFTIRFLKHRVVFAFCHGRWPDGEIDHIDRDRTNNRIENLREVTHAENHRNRGRPVSNTSGVTGVSWHKRDKVWRASGGFAGQQFHLGSFASMEAAVAARRAYIEKSGFSDSHGL